MILYVFLLVWLLRKCKKRKDNLEILIFFWATMFLGKNMKNNQSFFEEEHVETI